MSTDTPAKTEPADKPEKLTHPDSKTTVNVAADVVPTYESQGWSKAEAK